MKNLLLLSMLFLSAIGYSQQWTYNATYTADGGNPGGINAETDAPGQSIWTTIQAGSQPANIWSPVTAIPIPFNFYGSPVTHFKASQTGLVTFDTTAVLPTIPNENLPSANLPDSTICAFWDEFTAAAPTGNGDDIRVATFGTAPNRQFWIKWYSFEMGNPTVSFSYFAVVLEESTNNVYVVDQYSTGAAAFTGTVGVQESGTSATQFGTNTLPNNGNGSANTDNDFYCFAPELLVADNAGVLSMDNPIIPLTLGLQNVDVTVRNFGTNDLTTFNVEWEIDGTLQTPLTYTGPTIPAFTNSTSLNLGSYNFPSGFTELKFWTALPNGGTDGNPLDDTLTISACTALSGTYTIGGVSPDFATINEANNALASCGIVGPVVFNIAPGVYNESITTFPINGSSATNTVTFNGGSAATTSMVDSGPAVVALAGADYITWKNMTIENTAATDGFGFHLSDTSDYNTIDSCIILLDPTATFDVIGIVCSGDVNNDFTEANAANYCTFSNNEISGGEMGIHLEGPTANGSWALGINILNNEIHTMDDYGIYMDNQDSITVSGNKVYDNRSAGGDGIYCFDIANFDISYNEVYAPDYGIYVTDGNFDFAVNGPSRMVNNMVKSESDYAIYLDDVNELNIYHNTAYGNPGMRINDFTALNIRNNIFTSDNDYAFESDEATSPNVADYNLYWTPATNALFVRDGAGGIHADLATWQTATPALNGSSVEAPPFFAGIEDLHIVGSGPNDLGDNSVGILDDIDGDTRPVSPSTVVDMGADEYTPIADDAQAVSLFLGGIAPCGDSLTEVYMVFQNLGSNAITSMNATADITGDIVTTLNGTYTGSITFAESDTVLLGTINTYAGGNFDITAWTSLTGDGDVSNDTVAASFVIVPFEPMGIDGYGCGVDSALISAVSGFPASYEWYDAPTGGNLVGTGNSFMVPSIVTQNTYYLAYGQGISDSIVTTYASGNGCGGGNMFDVQSNGGSTLYGMRVHSDDAAGTPVPVNVYYVTGGYVGNETNAAAWTSAGSYTTTSGGQGVGSSQLILNTPIILPAGTPMGIYVEYDAEYTNGSTVYNNGDITVTTGIGLCSAFGGTNQGREFNGTLFFGGDGCSTIRTPVSAQQVVAPTVDLGVDSTVCALDYTLDGANADPQTTYNWSDGATTQTNTVTASGTYSVEITDSVGCIATDTVVLFISGLQIDSLIATADLCVGDSVQLSPVVSSNHPITFTWSSGQLTQDIVVNSADVYTFTATDSLGCTLSESSTVTVTDVPVAAFTDALSGDVLTVTSTATSADSTVYDFGDGTVVTGVNETHTYTSNGTFTVCQYVYNNCGSDTVCTTVEVTGIGIDEIAANNATLHPNPADAVINITMKNTTADVVRILTSEGKLVGTYDFSGSNQFTLDVSSFPSGVYFVNIESTNGIVVKRFVKE